jgi:hypothetical protein
VLQVSFIDSRYSINRCLFSPRRLWEWNTPALKLHRVKNPTKYKEAVVDVSYARIAILTHLTSFDEVDTSTIVNGICNHTCLVPLESSLVTEISMTSFVGLK